MTSIRRVALAAACVTSLAGALALTTPAAAAQPAGHTAVSACGQQPEDYDGTFTGNFNGSQNDRLTTTFTAPGNVEQDWNVNGWSGNGTGTYLIGPTGPTWTASAEVDGPIDGVSSEHYRATNVECARGTTEVTKISGTVSTQEKEIPFTLTRQQ
ncbi:hypothetical protein [Streptomyces luteolus]|uniref:Secreted protein n=1 Tax=Streptomyces luteolus TaxID=3043615 RepID=A0ABT6SVD7_9ACTN|nr:hypothetical protein [Streptomyces sp. B-S-A12]MDI3419572.1 hypothetical protein [Streptomyces sp. B-S-A12]